MISDQARKQLLDNHHNNNPRHGTTCPVCSPRPARPGKLRPFGIIAGGGSRKRPDVVPGAPSDTSSKVEPAMTTNDLTT